ncbi:MAG: restriction endonuclease subunit S [Aquincola sp.]|nr:restriction endonuclease subunit S [Aquincola sp.]
MSRQLVALGSVCVQDRTSVRPGQRDDLPYLGLEGIEAGTGQFVSGDLSKTPGTPQANSFRFDDRHVLYGKLRPYLNKVALPAAAGKCSTEIVPLLPMPRLDRQYVGYFLRSPRTVAQITERSAGAQMPRADMDFVLSLSIALPPLEEQRRIVDMLARAEGIVRLRGEAQRKAAELVPAIFIDIFGDPATNQKGWPTRPLSEVAEVISGVAKGRKLADGEGIEMPYMRVANVKDGYLDLSEVKSIEIKRSEVEKLLIRPGDLLMTEGGDPDKLGRAALWSGELEACVHQNHVFKVRANRARVSPTYLRSLAGSAYGKAYFLSVAKKTTGIASINKTQLSAFSVLLPPVEQQAEFDERARAVEAIATATGRRTGEG